MRCFTFCEIHTYNISVSKPHTRVVFRQIYISRSKTLPAIQQECHSDLPCHLSVQLLCTAVATTLRRGCVCRQCTLSTRWLPSTWTSHQHRLAPVKQYCGCVHACVRTYVCGCVRVYVCLWVRARVRMCVGTCMYCTYIHMNVCIYMGIARPSQHGLRCFSIRAYVSIS